ncbi:MAG: DUF452 family protein [Elusimicrobiales bacterium]|nr:DUF452 family protein [Elusimicrobiales bacterium]
MKHFLMDNGSDSLLLFFSGWGCDEHEFEHLKSGSDVLILYDYNNLRLEFDFSGYREINLLAFSAGVFAAAASDIKNISGRKTALSGNPYLFDGHFGLSQEIQEMLCGINEENAADFAKNYLVKTDEELAAFHNSGRTIESCRAEFESLKRLYSERKNSIKDIFDSALIGGDDRIFNIEAQKEFYGSRLRIVPNARHSIFFRIKSFDEIIDMAAV